MIIPGGGERSVAWELLVFFGPWWLRQGIIIAFGEV
jgi:hypothetical protein